MCEIWCKNIVLFLDLNKFIFSRVVVLCVWHIFVDLSCFILSLYRMYKKMNSIEILARKFYRWVQRRHISCKMSWISLFFLHVHCWKQWSQKIFAFPFSFSIQSYAEIFPVSYRIIIRARHSNKISPLINLSFKAHPHKTKQFQIYLLISNIFPIYLHLFTYQYPRNFHINL